ncbi:MAG: histidine ammonia-lyase [Fusobacteriaceae bacterium]
MKSVVTLGNERLTLENFMNVVRERYFIEITDEAYAKIEKSRVYVEKLINDSKIVYGLTTGFGKFSDVVISKDETSDLQKNLIISHSCGVGEAFSEEIVRGILLLRINNLIIGNSGIRRVTIDKMVEILNSDVVPVIPEKGSLGASGDLAPLSHMVLVVLGMGEAFYKGEKMSGSEALSRAGIKPLPSLSSKEGLALINGTQAMTSVGAIAVYEAINLMKTLDITAAITMESLNGITCAYDEKIHKIRGHKGQIDTAENILRILDGSKMVTKQGELRVQDPYTLRCTPQIHGASKDAINFVLNKVEIEMNAVTDNPIIFPDHEQVISGGNFHGQPMALPFDFLGIACSEMGNISERRLERLVNPQLNFGLPPFLTSYGGLHSGFMIVQYSAASLVSENKVLAHPASVDSIPSSGNQEDHVSMGTIAARKGYEILKNSRKVVAMELLAACQGVDLRGNIGLGRGSRAAYDVVRKHVSKLENDRVMYLDINTVEKLIMDGEIVRAVQSVIGEIKI